MFYQTRIPDRYYEFGTPYVTDYAEKKGHGLAYHLSPEESYELSSSFGSNTNVVIISLLSPYIWGFDFPHKANELILVSIDITNRIIYAQKKEHL